MSAGYFKCWRSADAMELIRANGHAFVLLAVIAYRAQRTSAFNRYSLKPGEALIGDFKNYGMSEQQYRTAKRVLEKCGFATFKPTTKGTVATLLDARIFDVRQDMANGQTNERLTDGQRTKPEKSTDKSTDGTQAKRPIKTGQNQQSDAATNEQGNGQQNPKSEKINDYQEVYKKEEAGSQSKFSLKKAFAEELLKGDRP